MPYFVRSHFRIVDRARYVSKYFSLCRTKFKIVLLFVVVHVWHPELVCNELVVFDLLNNIFDSNGVLN